MAGAALSAILHTALRGRAGPLLLCEQCAGVLPAQALARTSRGPTSPASRAALSAASRAASLELGAGSDILLRTCTRLWAV